MIFYGLVLQKRTTYFAVCFRIGLKLHLHLQGISKAF